MLRALRHRFCSAVELSQTQRMALTVDGTVCSRVPRV